MDPGGSCTSDIHDHQQHGLAASVTTCSACKPPAMILSSQHIHRRPLRPDRDPPLRRRLPAPSPVAGLGGMSLPLSPVVSSCSSAVALRDGPGQWRASNAAAEHPVNSGVCFGVRSPRGIHRKCALRELSVGLSNAIMYYIVSCTK